MWVKVGFTTPSSRHSNSPPQGDTEGEREGQTGSDRKRGTPKQKPTYDLVLLAISNGRAQQALDVVTGLVGLVTLKTHDDDFTSLNVRAHESFSIKTEKIGSPILNEMHQNRIRKKKKVDNAIQTTK